LILSQKGKDIRGLHNLPSHILSNIILLKRLVVEFKFPLSGTAGIVPEKHKKDCRPEKADRGVPAFNKSG
jgi:hypothetical protein